MEVGIETVNLKRILDIVSSRPVADRHGIAAEDVGTITLGSGVALLCNERIAKRMTRR
jgi:hypothetical protein